VYLSFSHLSLITLQPRRSGGWVVGVTRYGVHVQGCRCESQHCKNKKVMGQRWNLQIFTPFKFIRC